MRGTRRLSHRPAIGWLCQQIGAFGSGSYSHVECPDRLASGVRDARELSPCSLPLRQEWIYASRANGLAAVYLRTLVVNVHLDSSHLD